MVLRISSTVTIQRMFISMEELLGGTQRFGTLRSSSQIGRSSSYLSHLMATKATQVPFVCQSFTS
jgi:hypothetical protein